MFDLTNDPTFDPTYPTFGAYRTDIPTGETVEVSGLYLDHLEKFAVDVVIGGDVAHVLYLDGAQIQGLAESVADLWSDALKQSVEAMWAEVDRMSSEARAMEDELYQHGPEALDPMFGEYEYEFDDLLF